MLEDQMKDLTADMLSITYLGVLLLLAISQRLTGLGGSPSDGTEALAALESLSEVMYLSVDTYNLARSEMERAGGKK